MGPQYPACPPPFRDTDLDTARPVSGGIWRYFRRRTRSRVCQRCSSAPCDAARCISAYVSSSPPSDTELNPHGLLAGGGSSVPGIDTFPHARTAAAQTITTHLRPTGPALRITCHPATQSPGWTPWIGLPGLDRARGHRPLPARCCIDRVTRPVLEVRYPRRVTEPPRSPRSDPPAAPGKAPRPSPRSRPPASARPSCLPWPS